MTTARHRARQVRRALHRQGLGHLARKVVSSAGGEYDVDYREGMTRPEWEAVSRVLGRGEDCTDEEWEYYSSFPSKPKPKAMEYGS